MILINAVGISIMGNISCDPLGKGYLSVLATHSAIIWIPGFLKEINNLTQNNILYMIIADQDQSIEEAWRQNPEIY